MPPSAPAPGHAAPDVLPERLGEAARQSLEVSRDAALGAEVTVARARYGAVRLAVTDFGTREMIERMGYGWSLSQPADPAWGAPVQRDTWADSATVRLVEGTRLVEATAPTPEAAESAMRAYRSRR